VLIQESQQRRSRRWTYLQPAYYYHYIRVLILGDTPVRASIRALDVLVYQQRCSRSSTYPQTGATRSTPHSSTPLSVCSVQPRDTSATTCARPAIPAFPASLPHVLPPSVPPSVLLSFPPASVARLSEVRCVRKASLLLIYLPCWVSSGGLLLPAPTASSVI